MKRLTAITCVAMVQMLAGVVGCRSWPGLGSAADQAHKTTVQQPQTPASIAAAETQQAPAAESPTAQTPAQPAVSVVPGQGKISKIYPCAECGLVRLEKTMPQQVELGRSFEYNISVTNITQRPLQDIIVTEQIPEHFTYTSADPTATVEGNRLIWEIGSLGPGESRLIRVSGTAAQTGQLQYCTTVVTRDVPICTSVGVVRPKLKLTTSAPEGVLLCDPIPVKFVVSNAGSGLAKGVKIVNALPAGLQTEDGTSELVIEVGDLAPGQSRQFSATLRATRPGTYVNKAVASSTDGLKVEAEATTTVVDQPVLAINQSGPEREYLGRSVSYEITVTNVSDAPAKNAYIENDIPANVTSMKATVGAKLVGSKIVWALGTLGPNASKTVRVSFTPLKEGTLTNTVTAKAYCAESVTTTAKTTIAAIPAVLLEVIDIKDPVEVGGRTTYVITVTNQGSAPSTNIQISCILEDNVQYVSSTGATTGTIEGNVLTFAPLKRLPRKSRATWRVTVTALKAGDVRFKVTMDTNELSRPVEETEATRVYE